MPSTLVSESLRFLCQREDSIQDFQRLIFLPQERHKIHQCYRAFSRYRKQLTSHGPQPLASLQEYADTLVISME